MVRNFDIQERFRQPPVSLKLRRARMNSFGHVEKMGEDRQMKRVMRGYAGKRAKRKIKDEMEMCDTKIPRN